MSRIRSVHPGFFRDERLVAISMAARLLFIGLGVEADDKGIFEWKPITLKMGIFPGDNLDVASLLEELVAADAVRKYEIAGRQYGAIRNFRKFQKPKTPNDIHPMPSEIGDYVGLTSFVSETPPPEPTAFPRKVEKPFQMEDGGGKREEGEEQEKHISLDSEREFEQFYSTYPRRIARGQARKAYRAARKKASSELLLTGARKAAAEFLGKDVQFIPHPATWLNGERWLDAAVGSGEVLAQRDRQGRSRDDPMFGVL